MLEEKGSRWAETDWTAPKNDCIDDIIDRYNEDPEALQNYAMSDWVNLDECYTKDLIRRYETQRDGIMALFDSMCDDYGYTSTLEALEGDTIEDPEDMMAAIVNHAMTYVARMLLSELYPDF